MVPVDHGGVVLKEARVQDGVSLPERRGREDPFAALKIMIQDSVK